MDNRSVLETLAKNFTIENLTNLFRASHGGFHPEVKDYSQYLESATDVRSLHKLGQIDFKDGGRLILLAGEADKKLTSHSGKQRQYEIARKVLKDEYLDAGIFVFYDDLGHFRFSLITAQYSGKKREFSSFRRYTYFVSPEYPPHTFVNQIGKADFTRIDSILEAFSVEPVTNEFFKEYHKIFEEAEASITLKWNAEQKRLYTQRFFNRLMFLAFLERKGWLSFAGHKDYLRALFTDYQTNEKDKRANFHRSRLNTLFFWGLNNPRGDERDKPKFRELKRIIGDVPYLNGGLFEEEADDQQWFFSDAVVAKILKDLFYHFNFTVTESTPLDIEVAVDPEMLGKIFEELVTGRHETGSYYTPKPIVAFMCREALKGYLQTSLPTEKEKALALFVDKNNPSTLHNPELTLEALKDVKVCDPACGSGAYLLGMMHELLEQRECLFAAHVADATKIYDRKLEIIQNNLYGVDIDPFAVNIARLRLWLSLIVDFEGDNPPPLPNLDFKIEVGDSLTAPDPSGGLQPDMFRQQQIKEFLSLKNEFMSIHAGSVKKAQLDKQIKELRTKIKVGTHPKGSDESSTAFDWQVDFAEVFAPELAESTLKGEMVVVVNTTKGQMELTDAPKEGGFDIVLANPPYIRQELLGDYKDELKPIYPEVYNGTADLYVYFYARAHQLLRNRGVSCFISSNKWLRAGYGEKLRQHLLDSQAFSLVVDFGELPVFQTAATFPAVFLWNKQARNDTPTKWAVVKDLQECYSEGILEHVTRISQVLPATQFGKSKARLASISDAGKRDLMDSKGTPLGELVNNQIYFGIKTGLNEAFIINKETRDKLIDKDPKSAEILKPLLAGDDVRRYEFHYRDIYLVWTYIGVPIREYPAVFSYLKKFQNNAENRSDQGNYWWELRSCDYYDKFDKPKIIYPQIMMQGRFYFDKSKIFTNQKCFIISTDDYYLLGVLNSLPIWNYLQSKVVTFGDPDENGRLEPRREDILGLPIPNATKNECEAVAHLSEQAQKLHTLRRKRVEKFLREIGIEPAESTSRNPLEQPWSLTAEEFTRRMGRDDLKTFKAAQEETLSVTKEVLRVEKEIDERVKSLYRV